MSKQQVYTEAQQQQLRQEWRDLCVNVKQGKAQFSPGVIGLGSISVMGRAGHAEGMFPMVQSLDVVERLSLCERWAIDQARGAVEGIQNDADRAIGKQAYLMTRPGGAQALDEGGANIILREFNPSEHQDIVITFPLQGGRA